MFRSITVINISVHYFLLEYFWKDFILFNFILDSFYFGILNFFMDILFGLYYSQVYSATTYLNIQSF